jgi:2'-5' RNA ligase
MNPQFGLIAYRLLLISEYWALGTGYCLQMRLFVAIDLDPDIRERIARFSEGVRGLAPDVRWTAPEAMHITLKFIGEVSEDTLGRVKAQLEKVSAPPSNIQFGGTGFFPTPRSARVFWAGIQPDSSLIALAEAVDRLMGAIGIPFEERSFTPHLTLARSGSGRRAREKADRANNKFAKLQQRLAKMPEADFGTMTAREFILYQSKTSPKGAQYTKLARYELK